MRPGLWQFDKGRGLIRGLPEVRLPIVHRSSPHASSPSADRPASPGGTSMIPGAPGWAAHRSAGPAPGRRGGSRPTASDEVSAAGEWHHGSFGTKVFFYTERPASYLISKAASPSGGSARTVTSCTAARRGPRRAHSTRRPTPSISLYLGIQITDNRKPRTDDPLAIIPASRSDDG